MNLEKRTPSGQANSTSSVVISLTLLICVQEYSQRTKEEDAGQLKLLLN